MESVETASKIMSWLAWLSLVAALTGFGVVFNFAGLAVGMSLQGLTGSPVLLIANFALLLIATLLFIGWGILTALTKRP